MLSYRHGFHAGNHADVLKHLTLCLILRALLRKDKPFCVLDTHSGAGLYDLGSEMAQKNLEYTTGISKILENQNLQKLVPEYFEILKELNQGSLDPLKTYVGSPFLESKLMRECDKLTLIDLHPREYQSLLLLFGKDRRVNIQQIDAYHALSSALPPPIKRGLVFIDPSYEEKNEYHQVVKALKQGLIRFRTGIFAIWYPVLAGLQDESKKLVQDVKHLGLPLLQVELCVEPQKEERGMIGSGMLILNFPYKLDDELEPVLGELYENLAKTSRGNAKLKVLVAHP